MDSRGSYVSKILYVKMKELGPLGGGAHQAHPPRSTNVSVLVLNSTVSTPYYIVLDMIPRITVHFVRLYIINLLVFLQPR